MRRIHLNVRTSSASLWPPTSMPSSVLKSDVMCPQFAVLIIATHLSRWPSREARYLSAYYDVRSVFAVLTWQERGEGGGGVDGLTSFVKAIRDSRGREQKGAWGQHLYEQRAWCGQWCRCAAQWRTVRRLTPLRASTLLERICLGRASKLFRSARGQISKQNKFCP
jgi:hypothetical protein